VANVCLPSVLPPGQDSEALGVREAGRTVPQACVGEGGGHQGRLTPKMWTSPGPCAAGVKEGPGDSLVMSLLVANTKAVVGAGPGSHPLLASDTFLSIAQGGRGRGPGNEARVGRRV